MPCKGRQGVQCTLVNPRCFLLVCIKTFRHDWINLWLVIFIEKENVFCFISFRRFSAFVLCDGLVRMYAHCCLQIAAPYVRRM